MRRFSILAVYLIWAMPAFAQDASLRYATFPDLATAQSVSASAWAAVKCDPALVASCNPTDATRYVYNIVGLTDGRYAIELRLGDAYVGEHIRLPNGKSFDLTANQIASLATRNGMGTLLGDILQIALVNSRVLPAELTAITSYANTHASFKTSWNALISGPIDLESPLIWAVMGELQAAKVLSADRIAVITAQNPAAAVVTP